MIDRKQTWFPFDSELWIRHIDGGRSGGGRGRASSAPWRRAIVVGGSPIRRRKEEDEEGKGSGIEELAYRQDKRVKSYFLNPS